MRTRELKVGMRFVACGCEYVITKLLDGEVMARSTDSQKEYFFFLCDLCNVDFIHASK